MNTWNVHRMFIIYTQNIGIPKHEKHLRPLSSGTKLFITFEFKGFSTYGERHNLSMLTFPSAPTTCVPATRPLAWLLRAPKANRPPRTPELNWLFSNLSPRFRCVTSLTSLVVSSIRDFYSDISEWHVHSARSCEHLRSCLHLTNPCTEQKGSQPN